VLAKSIFVGGVFCVVPRLFASVIRAAADWQRWVASQGKGRRKIMNTSTSISKSPLIFFLLVFALSIPLWLIGVVTPLQLLPGLPVSSLMAFCPLIAASILVYREDKTTGVTELLKRSFDYRRIRAKIWYVPTVLLMPGIAVLAYGLMRLLQLPHKSL